MKSLPEGIMGCADAKPEATPIQAGTCCISATGLR